MPAGFPTNAFLPKLLWDAKIGCLRKLDRVQTPDGRREKKLTDIDMKAFIALADPDSVRKGWVHMAPGVYEDRLVTWTDAVPPRPPGQNADGKPLWQPTVLFRVKLAKSLGGEVRQFSSTAIVCLNSLDNLIDGWLSDPAGKDPSQCPVIRIAGKAAISGRNGTNYAPVWSTQGWRPRPDDMPLGGADDDYEPADEHTPAAAEEADPFAGAPPVDETDAPPATYDDDLPF